MELLDMSKDPLAPLPLLPRAGSAVGGPPPGAAALKTSSLSRMPELQQYLRQCDDQNYLKNYVKVLSAMPRDLLDDLACKIKARSAWLSAEEQREYKRAKLLNVMGAPCSPVQHRGGGNSGSADADAFCSQLLAGGGGSGDCSSGGGAVEDGMQLERLEMQPAEQQQQHSFGTPAAARARAVAQQQQVPGGSAGSVAAAAQPGSAGMQAEGTPDDEPAPAGLTAHRISPDGPPAATPQQQQQGGGGGRVRQATLLLPKP